MIQTSPIFYLSYSTIGNPTVSSKLTLLWSVLFGVVICALVYKLMEFISIRCFSAYGKLKSAQKIDWNKRGISTVHAIAAASVSLYLVLLSDFFYDTISSASFIIRNNSLSNSFLGISVGYFFTDMAMLLWWFPALGGAEYLLHHGLSLMSLILGITSGQAQLYIFMCLLTEITTPMVHMRWYLDVSGLNNSKAYVYNGVCLFVAWLVARVVLFMFFFGHMLMNFDQVKQITPMGFYSMLTIPPLLALLNLFWFFKILKGIIKAIAKSTRKQ